MARVGEFVYARTRDDELLRRKGAKIRGALADFEAEAERANEKALDWLRQEAMTNLERSVAATGRPRGSNTGMLERAIDDFANHETTAGGFRFMITARVFKMAPYWRNIEQGTSQFVGHRVPLAFQAGNGRFVAADPARYPKDRVSRGVRVAGVTGRVTRRRAGTVYGDPKGEAEGKQSWVTIHTPIAAHWYIKRSTERFERAGMYARFINTAVRRHNKDLGARLTKTNA